MGRVTLHKRDRVQDGRVTDIPEDRILTHTSNDPHSEKINYGRSFGLSLNLFEFIYG